ncbi:conserved hypothetical protein [Bradyrhizobium sp. ORS 278]|uniref:DUF4403 family protein n=1 Tax=Bradyrhizobium sp. (strain ORS 278) TaxID=114615 RepID=UPI00015080A2|nr:DUF4403 family protein [Bradyrhizobium sp. ORS 278]CAL79369.1 conserved hypothetical protein [Bradyrhizobium sp. ORS 278]
MNLPTPRPDWQSRPHPLAPKSQRPPRRSRPRLRLILIGAVALTALVLIGIIVAEVFLFSGSTPAPPIAQLPPLPPATRNSIVMAPISISLGAIRDAAERTTPRNFSGKADNPVSQILQNADIGWTVNRGAIAATGTQDTLSLATPLSGRLNVTGSLSSKATGAIGDALGGLLGSDAAKQIGGINIKNLNATADIKGNVLIAMRPRVAASWYVEPNFSAQVNLGDTALTVAGARVNVPAQMKPIVEKTVNDQLAGVSDRLRKDPTLKRTAQAQWARACRSVPLQGTAPGLPAVWLEIKPTRALAAQPVIDSTTTSITIGIEAETKVTPAETKPVCPFPEKITIVPPTTGGINVAVPIDVPFTELNKLIDSQLAGRTFPEDGSGPVAVTVKHATVVPSGNRLLISLQVKGKEKESFFGFGADATVHIWGRPMVDQAQQILRLSDLQLAVESEAAFGLLGAAARAAIPHLQRALLERSVIDLKPFADNVREKIATAIAEMQKNENGIRVDTDVNNLALADITFDATTLRVIATAEGSMMVRINTLPGL